MTELFSICRQAHYGHHRHKAHGSFYAHAHSDGPTASNIFTPEEKTCPLCKNHCDLKFPKCKNGLDYAAKLNLPQ